MSAAEAPPGEVSTSLHLCPPQTGRTLALSTATPPSSPPHLPAPPASACAHAPLQSAGTLASGGSPACRAWRACPAAASARRRQPVGEGRRHSNTSVTTVPGLLLVHVRMQIACLQGSRLPCGQQGGRQPEPCQPPSAPALWVAGPRRAAAVASLEEASPLAAGSGCPACGAMWVQGSHSQLAAPSAAGRRAA